MAEEEVVLPLPPRAGLAHGDPLVAGVRLPGGGVLLLDIRAATAVTAATELLLLLPAATAAAGSWTTAGLRSMRSTNGVSRSAAADELSSELPQLLLGSCRSSRQSPPLLPPQLLPLTRAAVCCWTALLFLTLAPLDTVCFASLANVAEGGRASRGPGLHTTAREEENT